MGLLYKHFKARAYTTKLPGPFGLSSGMKVYLFPRGDMEADEG